MKRLYIRFLCRESTAPTHFAGLSSTVQGIYMALRVRVAHMGAAQYSSYHPKLVEVGAKKYCTALVKGKMVNSPLSA